MTKKEEEEEEKVVKQKGACPSIMIGRIGAKITLKGGKESKNLDISKEIAKDGKWCRDQVDRIKKERPRCEREAEVVVEASVGSMRMKWDGQEERSMDSVNCGLWSTNNWNKRKQNEKGLQQKMRNSNKKRRDEEEERKKEIERCKREEGDGKDEVGREQRTHLWPSYECE